MKNNSSVFLLFLSVLLLASCEWFKPARDGEDTKVYSDEDISEIQGKQVFDPETGTYRTVREVTEKVDTVRWTELSADRYPPIVSDGSWTNVGGQTDTPTTPSGTPGKYNVAMLLPFFAQSGVSEINDNSIWAIQFYGGAKLAYDNLTGTGLGVNILDTDEGATTRTSALLRSADLQKADLIIGPYKRDNVALAADFAKQNKKPLVVPYNAQMGMVENNPWYIQVNPSLKSHCEAITRHVRRTYRPEDVVLVARNKDSEQERLKYFQDANAAISGSSAGARFREYLVTGVALNPAPYIREGSTTVFIVPSWTDQTFVYSLLRQLMIQKGQGNDIVVYGMPQWMDFEQVEADFYEQLNVHVSSAFFVNEEDERVRQFKRRFFDAYGTIPTEEAFLGHDIMLYFGRMLDKWGKDFYTRLDSEPFDVLHGRFEFDRVVLQPEKHRENLTYFDQLENTFVHILEFRDFHFQPAD